MLLALAVAAVEKVIGGSNPSWWPLQQAGRSSSLATGETTVTTCFRYTCIKWGGSIHISIPIVSQDGEVDAALVSGCLGTGAARGEHLQHSAPSSTSPSSSIPTTPNLTPAALSKLYSSLFPILFPSLPTFQISKPSAVLLFSKSAG